MDGDRFAVIAKGQHHDLQQSGRGVEPEHQLPSWALVVEGDPQARISHGGLEVDVPDTVLACRAGYPHLNIVYVSRPEGRIETHSTAAPAAVGPVAHLPVTGAFETSVGIVNYPERVLDLSRLDLEEIATALSDQTDYDHRWLIDPKSGQVAFWTSDTGIDGQHPVDLDELDLIPIDPLPSYVWYQDMADFAEGVSDDTAGRRLGRAIRGKGAFRRFKDELYEEYPELVAAWHVFRDARAKRRAVEWLLDQRLIADEAAEQFLNDHPDPDLP